MIAICLVLSKAHHCTWRRMQPELQAPLIAPCLVLLRPQHYKKVATRTANSATVTSTRFRICLYCAFITHLCGRRGSHILFQLLLALNTNRHTASIFETAFNYIQLQPTASSYIQLHQTTFSYIQLQCF